MPLPTTFDDRLDAAEVKHYIQGKMMVPPSKPEHFATMGWVEEMIAGLRWAPVDAAVMIDMPGTLDATFNVLTAGANGAFPAVDGDASNGGAGEVVPAVGKRYLLGGQTDKKQVGIYELTDAGSATTPWKLTRAADANNSPAAEFLVNKMVTVAGGFAYGGATFKFVTEGAVVLGTTELEFVEWVDARLDQDTVEITGADAMFDADVTHALNTLLVSVDAFDTTAATDPVPCTVGFLPVNKSTIRVVTGAKLATGQKITLMIRGRING